MITVKIKICVLGYFCLCIALLYFYKEAFFILSWSSRHYFVWASVLVVGLVCGIAWLVFESIIIIRVIQFAAYIVTFVFVWKFVYLLLFSVVYKGEVSLTSVLILTVSIAFSGLVIFLLSSTSELTKFLVCIISASLIAGFYSIEYIKLVS